MSWEQIHVGILHNLRLEALRVTKPDLRLASARLDDQATGIHFRIVNHFAPERTWPIELNYRLRAHRLTRIRLKNAV